MAASLIFWGSTRTLVSGLAMAPGIVWILRRKSRFGRCLTSDAEVVGVVVDEGCKRLRYQLPDTNGDIVMGMSDSSSRFARERVGARVRVVYHQDWPTWNELDRWSSKYGDTRESQ